jgi:hypothetical protein
MKGADVNAARLKKQKKPPIEGQIATSAIA